MRQPAPKAGKRENCGFSRGKIHGALIRKKKRLMGRGAHRQNRCSSSHGSKRGAANPGAAGEKGRFAACGKEKNNGLRTSAKERNREE